MTQTFQKMHGLGNDFVILRGEAGLLTPEQVRRISDRHYGVGCDQLIIMEPAQDARADIFMRIYNPDGSEAGACGNATRCVAHIWMSENNAQSCVIQTIAGLLSCDLADRDYVRVNMGPARLAWEQIPLAEDRDTAAVSFVDLPLEPAVAVSMGNPHCVFFVEDVENISIESLGPLVERHPLFPQRTNVEFAQIIGPETIRMRVWERGAGITQACGSGACATMVAAVRRGLVAGRKAEIVLDGGSLFLEWRDDGDVLMTGPVAYVFDGTLS